MAPQLRRISLGSPSPSVKHLAFWPWWSVASIGVAWVLIYGFWLVWNIRSVAAGLAQACADDRWGCNLIVMPDWWDWIILAAPPLILLAVRWALGKRVQPAA